MKPSPMTHHPFLRWYEVLLLRLLFRSPRIRVVLVHGSPLPIAWVLRKSPMSKEPVEILERTFANSPDIEPA